MEFIYSFSEKSTFAYVYYICLFIYFRFLSRHGFETNKLLNEMESQKELLLTYERTLSHKDSIVANVTTAIQKQVSLLIEGNVSSLHKKPFPFHICNGIYPIVSGVKTYDSISLFLNGDFTNMI